MRLCENAPTPAQSDITYAVGGTRPLPVRVARASTRVAPARYRRGAHVRADAVPGATRYRRPRRPRRRHRLLKVFVVAMLVVLTVLGMAGRGPLSALGGIGSAAGRMGESAMRTMGLAPSSTPVAEWHAGEVPELYQIDPVWADEPYAGGTVGVNGCGPTCLTMAYVALTGRTDMDPAAIAAFSEREGYTVDGMTAWALMTEGAHTLGLTSEELPANAASIRAALEAGQVIIASVRPGDFTTTGHFIVLAGIAANGELEIRDPNSAERTHETWSIDRVLGQCANLWALSA